MHKFKYTSSTDGDKGTTHVLQELAEPARLLSLVALPATEDAGDVIIQIQLSQTVSDGYFISGINLAILRSTKVNIEVSPQDTKKPTVFQPFHLGFQCTFHTLLSKTVTSTAPTGS